MISNRYGSAFTYGKSKKEKCNNPENIVKSEKKSLTSRSQRLVLGGSPQSYSLRRLLTGLTRAALML